MSEPYFNYCYPDPINEPKYAALALNQGYTIDLQPGFGGRYELILFKQFNRKFLFAANLNWIMELKHDIGMLSWIPYGLRGSWADLRPVIAALGYAQGPKDYTRYDYDRKDEAENRVQRDPTPTDALDVRIGKAVRRLLVAGGELEDVVS